VLLPDFIAQPLTRSSAEGSFFLSAIAKRFLGQDDMHVTELKEADLEAHSFFLANVGRILLLTLTSLASPHEESRKVAYGLLVRIAPLISAMSNSARLHTSVVINDYLGAHHNEFCASAFPASPEQLFELSALFSTYLPVLTHRVLNE
jgi:hypothetical protein